MTTGALRPPAWTELALCAQADADSWFPEVGGSVLYVKAICRRCPVRQPCLGLALDLGEAHGIWAGLSPQERERAAEPYQRGASLAAIIASADADAAAARVVAAEHNREAAATATAASAAAYAARRAALRQEQSPVPQSREEAA